MLFEEFSCHPNLNSYVENYWFVASNEKSIIEQKIIPDGYPEIILDHGDAYEIKLNDTWELQAAYLFSGQIRKYFYLRNTGKISMTGIKLKPHAPSLLFGLPGDAYVDRVQDISQINSKNLTELKEAMQVNGKEEFNKVPIDEFFLSLVSSLKEKNHSYVSKAIDLIIQSQGQADVEQLASDVGTGRRNLEKSFRNEVGLSPKYYSRIVRFNSIFKIMQKSDPSWCQLAVDAGYYDQSHFIKDFKTFSGEHPSSYGFDKKTLANFFLKR